MYRDEQRGHLVGWFVAITAPVSRVVRAALPIIAIT
jgi:hypothetical protein